MLHAIAMGQIINAGTLTETPGSTTTALAYLWLLLNDPCNQQCVYKQFSVRRTGRRRRTS